MKCDAPIGAFAGLEGAWERAVTAAPRALANVVAKWPSPPLPAILTRLLGLPCFTQAASRPSC